MANEGVSEYRLCFLDQAGSTQGERLFFAQDDDEAIDIAGRSSHPFEMKLWKDAVLVGHFRPFIEIGQFGRE